MTDWTAIVREAKADHELARRDIEIARAKVEEAQAAYQVAVDRETHMRSTVEWARRKEADQPASEAELASLAASESESELRLTDTLGAEAVTEPDDKTLVDRCKDALERFGRPVRTTEVRDSINRGGFDFSTSQIGSTLKYLSERRKPAVAMRLGDGVWRLADPPPGAESRERGDPVLNGEGRLS